MSKRFAYTVPVALAVLGLVGLFAGGAWAQGSVAKHRGSAVPAIVGETGSAASGVEVAAEPLSIPAQRLAVVFLLICGLIYLTYFGLKRYMNWQKISSGKRRSVGVIDTIPLGGKRFVTVTRVYDRILVLGVGDETVTLLTELNDEEMSPAAATPAVKAKHAENFLSLISTLTRRKREEKSTQATARAAEGETAIL